MKLSHGESSEARNLLVLFAEHSSLIKNKKGVLDNYAHKVVKLKKQSELLNEEVKKTFPEKKFPETSMQQFHDSSESESENSAEFIPVSSIYFKEINSLKQEKKALKKHINELLHVMGRDSENDEDYSSEEWEDIKKPERKVSSETLNPLVSAWEPIPMNDDYRLPIAYKTGGIPLLDEHVQSKIRSVGKELVREIGRKLLNGDFNLTRVTVPIKCMQANTALHNTLKSGILLPPYLNYAGRIADPLERLKLVAAASIGSFYYLSTFEKPINPVLGETLYGELEDGTKLYAEQSSHHPPISHFQMENPSYRVTGYFNFSAKAGLNSVTVTNYGKKLFQFPDGHTIAQNCGEDLFGGTFFGTLRHECAGTYQFTDHTYQNICKIKFGVKDKPSDYFDGAITDKNGKVISKVFGSWIGYMDFDGVRYWDVRHIKPSEVKLNPNLPSDSELRKDLQLLRQNLVDEAQAAKETIENLQRSDRKFREKFHPH